MWSGRRFRNGISIATAVLLMGLAIAQIWSPGAGSAEPNNLRCSTVSLVRNVVPPALCMCMSGRCHMPNCPCNPDYWRSHSLYRVVFACGCNRLPATEAVMNDSSSKRLPIPGALTEPSIVVEQFSAHFRAEVRRQYRPVSLRIAELPPRIA